MKLTVTVLCAFAMAAQDSHFEVRSRLVLLPVTVTDARGTLVQGLDAPDFVILDNGRARKAAVDTIGTGVAPIALVIAVQSSGISAAVLEKVRKVGSMIQPLITGERGCAGLLSFAERVSWLQDCTGDADALDRALDRLRPGDYKRARMLDAVNAAVARLSELPNMRRVLLLISETRDRGSEADLAVMTAAAQTAAVTVYAASYSAFKTAFTSRLAPAITRRGREEAVPNVSGSVDSGPQVKPFPKLIPPEQSLDVLTGIGELLRLHTADTTEVLTKGTGGTTLPFLGQKGLEEAIGKLGAELHTQYVLSFAPDDAMPGYHSLEVRVVRAGEFRVRARPGYWWAGEAR